jgi:hypothetical protein
MPLLHLIGPFVAFQTSRQGVVGARAEKKAEIMSATPSAACRANEARLGSNVTPNNDPAWNQVLEQ